MKNELCFWLLCFAPPTESNAPKIFGFAEFISALAILALTYSLTDVRYRFRLAVAPIPLYRYTFYIIGLIGLETVISEVWLAEKWWLPKIEFITRSILQGCFGLLFLATFMLWVWFAHIRPPVFSRWNYKKYTHELYSYLVKGSDSDLVIIADELRRSAKSLVLLAPNIHRQSSPIPNDKQEHREIERYAYDVLQLIANRKLCRHIISAAPTTAIVLFQEAAAAKKHHLPFGAFAKNITAEAIGNLESPLFHEINYYQSGLLGHIQPFIQTIYGNYALVEGLCDHVGSPLDVDYQDYAKWNAHQWSAYNRATITAINAYVRETKGISRSHSIYRAVHNIQHSFDDAYKLGDIAIDYLGTDIYNRLEAAVDFLINAVSEIDNANHKPYLHKLRRLEGDYKDKDLYDLLAEFMFKLIDAASFVSSPADKAWAIHHNMVWHQFFSLTNKSQTWKILQYKLRRLLYNEIFSIKDLPNYKNVRIFGYCLNVMGLNVTRNELGRDYRPLHKVTLSIARRHFANLWRQRQWIAEVALIGSITYDAERNQLAKTYIRGLNNEAPKEHLQLEPAQ